MKRILLFLVLISGALLAEDKYTYTAKVESIRESNYMTIISNEILNEKGYLLINNNKEIGNIEVITVLTESLNYYRYVIRLTNNSSSKIYSGVEIGLRKKDKSEKIVFTDKYHMEKVNYKDEIKSDVDNRIMMLIPGGKFVYGSNNGKGDEFPKTNDFSDDFYMDKYEVSNLDYYKFVKANNSKPPKSWKDGVFPVKYKNLPVIVSYYEAEKYAKWANKRLPTEQEWEKAANGTKKIIGILTDDGYMHIVDNTIYPWGNKFNPKYCNSMENRTLKTRGLMSVYSFEKYGKSAYGLVNMAGNISEWTSSWYRPYPGNNTSNERYGKQVKVIKGGSWFHNKDKLRITNRELGGFPNLYEDNIAGFRCVKKPAKKDLKN